MPKRLATNHEVKRLRAMAASGLVSITEANRALGRSLSFAQYYARTLGLDFADGTLPLMQRLIWHRRTID